jgi:hypothetical protein
VAAFPAAIGQTRASRFCDFQVDMLAARHERVQRTEGARADAHHGPSYDGLVGRRWVNAQ